MRLNTRTSLLAAAAAACAIIAPTTAAAQIQISTTSNAPALGSMVRGSSATTFTVTNGGTVTRTSGDGIRVRSTSVTAPTVTISCGLLNLSGLCALRQIRVTVQPVASSTSQITKFTVGGVQGNILWAIGSPPTPGPSLSFDLKPLGLLGTGSFTLGMDVWTAAGLASGNYHFDYVVTATFI
ncbi:MAG: hypothetical protein ACO1OJ_16240 [Brevundimonas sp.]